MRSHGHKVVVQRFEFRQPGPKAALLTTMLGLRGRKDVESWAGASEEPVRAHTLRNTLLGVQWLMCVGSHPWHPFSSEP
jgi:hypothetical protein